MKKFRGFNTVGVIIGVAVVAFSRDCDIFYY